MLKIGKVNLTYGRGEWGLLTTVSTQAARAKDGQVTIEENHGSIYRALPAARRYLLDDAEALSQHERLVKVLRLAIRIFKSKAGYTFAEKVQFQLEAPGGGHHSSQTMKNHGGVYLCRHVLNDHPLSQSPTTVIKTYPGTHAQACNEMLSADIGDILTLNPELDFRGLLKAVQARITLIAQAAASASPADYASGDLEDEGSEDDEGDGEAKSA